MRYDVTGNHQWTDPSTGSVYTIPTFTSTQSLSPEQQAIKERNTATQFNLADTAKNQSYMMRDYLSHGVDLSGAPQAGNAQNLFNVPGASTSYDAGGPIQKSLGGYGDVTTSYGAGDFSADRQHVEDSLMARMNPQLQIEQQRI